MATTTNDGGDGGNSAWEIFKLIAMVIGAIVILGWVISFVMTWAVPLIIVAGILFLGYKLFLEDNSSDTVTTQDPPLLEHQAHSEADDILSDDPLEQKFEELEQRDSTAP